MTLKEAREAASRRLPVLCDGIRYERIAFVGIHYSERHHAETPTVKLLDKRGARCRRTRSGVRFFEGR